MSEKNQSPLAVDQCGPGDAVPSIGAYLKRAYLPPYGTTLDPSQFHWTAPDGHEGGGWRVSARNTDGVLGEYLIKLTGGDDDGPGLAVCWRDGQQCDYEDAVTLSHNKDGEATVRRWYDWVLRQDAAGALATRANQWDGDDLAAKMHRLEHGVVIGDEHQCFPRGWTLGKFQQWLDKASALSPVVVKAYAVKKRHRMKLDAHSILEDTLFATTEHLNCSNEPDKKTFETFGFHISMTPNRWLRGGPHVNMGGFTTATPEVLPLMTLLMQGSQIGMICAHAFVPFNKMAELYELDDDVAADDEWWAIRAEGTNLALVFPRNHVNLFAETKGDGAELSIRVADHKGQTDENRLTDRFNRVWGAWLDQSRALTPEELNVGIAHAEAIARGDADPLERWFA